MPSIFTARAKFYFNTPEMLRRLGKWRNDILAKTGAYGRGVFRNKLGRPQLKQTRERTVTIDMQIPSRSRPGQMRQFNEVVFVPRTGPVVVRRNGLPAPRIVAAAALQIVANRVRGQGAGKPPRMGPSKLMRQGNTFSLDPTNESVVIGTEPLTISDVFFAASIPNQLDEGISGWVANSLLPGGGVFRRFAEHPYVASTAAPVQQKLEQIIQRRKAG